MNSPMKTPIQVPQLLPRSQNKVKYRYTIEEQSPAGDWNKSTAGNSREDILDHATYLASRGRVVRVIDEHQ